MRKVPYISLAAFFAILGVAGPAAAGIVIHDIREFHGFTMRDSVKDVSVVSASQSASTGTSGQGSSDTDGAPQLRKKGGPPVPLQPIEILQIRAGLITEEEAMSGCGGASAATGPAGLLPLLVAAGALVRRRRR